MAGKRLPVVFASRFTTYAGGGDFPTVALDLADYESAVIHVWRGMLVGSMPSFGVTFEESTDSITWTTCSGTTAEADPGQQTEVPYMVTLGKRFVRVRVSLGGANTVASCYAYGHLVRRQH